MRYPLLVIPLLFISSVLPLLAEEPIRVDVDLKSCKEWKIDPLLFGSFSEEHWGDMTPGIYEQYIINPSFEDWYTKGGDDGNSEEKSNLVWKTIPRVDNLAFPWEKVEKHGTPTYEQVSDAFNTSRAQRVNVCDGDIALLYQRLALPSYRTDTYNVSFYIKASPGARVKVFMTTLDVNERFQEISIADLSGDWKKYDLELKIQSPKELHLDRYGIYNLGFEVSGGGYADFDLVTLFPSDCIDGMYNPETIRYFKEYGPTMVRWPGGNFTSGYHWYDGIGKFEERKSLPNLAWGGLCTNHMGIDEFMRFCELTGVTPVIGVGYDEDNISSKEIADWVEYCNGDISTPMGAVRAKNGHPKPYDIKYWGIGNEVYGSYQIGYQPDSELYAKGLIKIVEAIRQVDPDVKIIASAYGAHNHYRNPSSRWTETVVQTAGDHIDYLDVHSYVYGPTLKQVKRAKPNAIIKAFESANLCLDEYIDEIRRILQSTGKSHIRLAFLEWGVLPKVYRSHCIYLPCRQSFVNLLCSGIYLNEFIKNGDFVKMGAHHNFSFYVQPVAVHGECVNPRTILYKHYTEMAGGNLLDLEVSNMPVYNVTTKWSNIGPHENVPEVDVLAVRKGKTVFVVMINKNMNRDYDVQLDMTGKRVRAVNRETYTHESPFDALVWKTRSHVSDPVIDSEVMKHKKGQVNVVLPALSYTIMTMKLWS